MICPNGGFPSIRHNEVRDLTADLLTEVCHDVEIEPKMQELTGVHKGTGVLGEQVAMCIL